MNIVLVGNSALSMFKFRSNLIKALVEQEHTIHIICPEDEFVSDLINLGVKWSSWEVVRDSKNPIIEMNSFLALFRLIMNIKPDFMLCYTIKPNIYGSIIARILNIKTLAVVTGLGYVFFNENITSRFAKKLYKIAFEKLKYILFLNPEDISDFIADKIISSPQAILLPGEGIDTAHFFPKKDSRNKNLYLYFGRLMWDKGFHELTEAAKIVKTQHPEVEFRVVGKLSFGNPSDVPSQHVLKQAADGIITYQEFVKDVRSLIAEASYVLLPSYREGIPMSVLEAAAMGVPSIVTNVPGCRDVVVDSFNGYVCEVKSAESLANKILRSLTLNDREYEDLSLNSRKTVLEKFSSERVLNSYKEIFKLMGFNAIL
jgi:glycosyltransferase involved in cell wall biosynthesis